MNGVLAQRRSKEAQTKLLDEEIVNARALFEQGFYTRPHLSALERERADVEGDRGEHVSEIARAKGGPTELAYLVRFAAHAKLKRALLG